MTNRFPTQRLDMLRTTDFNNIRSPVSSGEKSKPSTQGASRNSTLKLDTATQSELTKRIKVLQRPKPRELKSVLEVRVPTEKQSKQETPIKPVEQSINTSIRRSSAKTVEKVREYLVNDQSENKLDTQQLKMLLRERHRDDMSLIIYVDPEADGRDIYLCPDDKPELHEDCKQAAQFAK